MVYGLWCIMPINDVAHNGDIFLLTKSYISAKQQEEVGVVGFEKK